MRPPGNRIRRIIGWILALGILALLMRPAINGFGAVKSDLARPAWSRLALGIFGVFTFFALRAGQWWTLTQPMVPRPPGRAAIRIWFLTEFTRFLPGNIWSFLGRAGAYRLEGVPVPVTAATLVREAITTVATAAVLLPLGSLVSPGVYGRWEPYALGFGSVGAALLLGLLLPLRIKSLVPNLVNRIGSILLGLAGWIAFGLGGAAILRAFHTPGTLTQLAALGLAAWMLGYLSLITPAGLGVREVVLASLLVSAVGVSAPTAATLALASRLALTAVEGIVVLVVLMALPRSRAEDG